MERTIHAKCLICLGGDAYVRAVSVRGSRRWHTYICEDCRHTWTGEEQTYESPRLMGGAVVNGAMEPERRSRAR